MLAQLLAPLLALLAALAPQRPATAGRRSLAYCGALDATAPDHAPRHRASTAGERVAALAELLADALATAPAAEPTVPAAVDVEPTAEPTAPAAVVAAEAVAAAVETATAPTALELSALELLAEQRPAGAYARRIGPRRPRAPRAPLSIVRTTVTLGGAARAAAVAEPTAPAAEPTAAPEPAAAPLAPTRVDAPAAAATIASRKRTAAARTAPSTAGERPQHPGVQLGTHYAPAEIGQHASAGARKLLDAGAAAGTHYAFPMRVKGGTTAEWMGKRAEDVERYGRGLQALQPARGIRPAAGVAKMAVPAGTFVRVESSTAVALVEGRLSSGIGQVWSHGPRVGTLWVVLTDGTAVVRSPRDLVELGTAAEPPAQLELAAL